ncbi:MAG: CDP-alcohol phosphatidyltransferase family protein [Spirochaetaceae bacterium]|nr:MAG: CDP-alcohol phosphatidyltransferase family protein [Spirochaetaceae bacterium]
MEIRYNGENVLTVPNMISLYRLLMFPVILVLALSGNERWFVILLCINLVSDILDGQIARRFGLVTRLGGALDNLADMGTYALALYGIFRFRWAEIRPHAWLLYLFLAVFVLSYVVAFVRFGKIPGLHLYAAVAAGYLQGAFFFVLFVWGFELWFYVLAIGWGVVAYIEKIAVLLTIDSIRPGIKGLYWLKNKQS